MMLKTLHYDSAQKAEVVNTIIQTKGELLQAVRKEVKSSLSRAESKILLSVKDEDPKNSPLSSPDSGKNKTNTGEKGKKGNGTSK
jgi:hypothetical protein